MSWRYLFQEITLERGKSYVEKESVYNVKRKRGGYEAIVSDTKLHHIHINVANGEVGTMTCTCPGAVNGWYCRHMAAVLYALEQRNEEMNIYRSIIDSVISQKINMEVEFSKILFIDIPCMIEKEKYQMAFQVTVYLIGELYKCALNKQNMAEELNQLITISYDIWHRLLKKDLDLKLKAELFYWLIDKFEHWDLNKIQDGMLNIIMNHFHEEIFLKEKLKLVNRMAETYKSMESILYYS